MVCFGTKQRVKRYKGLQINSLNDYIQHVPSYKYLGVILDSSLSFKLQIQATMNKVLHNMFILSKVRQYLLEKSAILIYKSMLLPYFDYGDIVYMFSSKNELDKLERLQESMYENIWKKQSQRNEDHQKINNTGKKKKLPFE